MSKPSLLRDYDDVALLEHLEQSRREHFGLRLQHATGELENTAGLRAAKREIARTLTLVRQRGLDPDTAASSADNE